MDSEVKLQISEHYQNWLGDLMPRKRAFLWEKHGRKCHWCGSPTRLVQEDSWDRATTDHIMPRYKGGTNDESNLVSACNRCNNRRNHEDMCGLSEGSLLGKYKAATQTNPQRKVLRHATGKSETDVLRTQRDQAQVAVTQLRAHLALLKAEIEGMTVWKIFRRNVARWIGGQRGT